MTVVNSSYMMIVDALQKYWNSKGCEILPACELPGGSDTFPSSIFFNIHHPYHNLKIAYAQTCYRPQDVAKGNPCTKISKYNIFRVILNTGEAEGNKLYYESLYAVGGAKLVKGIKEKGQIEYYLVKDDDSRERVLYYKNGMEISRQLQEPCIFKIEEKKPIHKENFKLKRHITIITYGIERLAMCMLNVKTIHDLWKTYPISLQKSYQEYENEMDHYYVRGLNIPETQAKFVKILEEISEKLSKRCYLSAYSSLLEAIHVFNLLDCTKKFKCDTAENSHANLSVPEHEEIYKQALMDSRQQILSEEMYEKLKNDINLKLVATILNHKKK